MTSKIALPILLVSALLLFGSAKTAAEPTAPGVPVDVSSTPFGFMPKNGYSSPVNASYISPSPDTKIAQGEKIDRLFERSMAGENIVQRLTDKSYWISIDFYNSVVYVGKEGVLVLDPLAHGASERLLQAIQTITSLPVTALVYSHSHSDHIGGIGIFAENALRANVKLEIIATNATADKLDRLNSDLSRPTKIVSFDGGEYRFEDVTVRFRGFNHFAHTDDSSAVLFVEEEIVHVPDYINPDQMPYLNFGASENYHYYASNLEALAALDWSILSGGHANIGYRDDLDFMFEYLKDLNTAVAGAMKHVSWSDHIRSSLNNHQAFSASWYQAAKEYVVKELRPKYGNFYGFEDSVPYQAEMALEATLINQ